MTLTDRTETLIRLRDDVGLFAEHVVGQPLWPHQLELARSTARIRVACAGRQVGKTRTLALLALHDAFGRPGRRVLILSAGDDAAKDLLAEISALAQAPLLAGSVIDDDKSLITLSNGSSIRSVPASEKQVRGKSIDLLILDEAAYIGDDIWRAARYTIIARPDSRVVMASTPRGRRDRFFAQHYHLAAKGRVDDRVSVESFHWPSTVSPMVDAELVEFWRRSDPPRIFATEVLAEWVDEAGAFFTSDEIDACIADYQLIDPAAAHGQLVVAGVDWGVSNDASAVVALGALDDSGRNVEVAGEGCVYFVAHADERFRFGLNAWAKHLAVVSDPSVGGFGMYTMAAEANGVGSGPTETLQEEFRRRGLRRWTAQPVWTDNKRKQTSYGVLKLLLQQRRLVLPRFVPLLAQLEALEFETSESGMVKIAVPENRGHDDLADALMQAASCLNLRAPAYVAGWGAGPRGAGDELVTGGGVRIRERPKCAPHRRAFTAPKGADDTGDGW